ncbi:hypothetical protein DFQ26_003787 [Actinomortierella ambigua]|nr:hypothetical protein DFQ26_003787 [Actinomortierella ambigua]
MRSTVSSAAALSLLFLLSLILAPSTVEAGFFEVNIADWSPHSIIYEGVLHYKVTMGSTLDFAHRRCPTASVVLSKYLRGIGGYGPCHSAVKNEMGLSFSDGPNNSTIMEAYDGYSKTFFPCTKVDDSSSSPYVPQASTKPEWTTYICGPIPMVFENGVPPPPPPREPAPAPCPFPEPFPEPEPCLESPWPPVVERIFMWLYVLLGIMALLAYKWATSRRRDMGFVI